jgi:zinc-finger binding domain of transposase IS66
MMFLIWSAPLSLSLGARTPLLAEANRARCWAGPKVCKYSKPTLAPFPQDPRMLKGVFTLVQKDAYCAHSRTHNGVRKPKYGESQPELAWTHRAAVSILFDPPCAQDVTKTLDVVPRQMFVTEHVREKFSCRSCEKISQPPHAAQRIGTAAPQSSQNLLPSGTAALQLRHSMGHSSRL